METTVQDKVQKQTRRRIQVVSVKQGHRMIVAATAAVWKWAFRVFLQPRILLKIIKPLATITRQWFRPSKKRFSLFFLCHLFVILTLLKTALTMKQICYAVGLWESLTTYDDNTRITLNFQHLTMYNFSLYKAYKCLTLPLKETWYSRFFW